MKTERDRSFVWTRDLIADGFSFVCVALVVAVFAFGISGAEISSIVARGLASMRSCMYCRCRREFCLSPGAPINQLAIVQNAIFSSCFNTNADARRYTEATAGDAQGDAETRVPYEEGGNTCRD
jgi:hypothetical protein